MACIDSVCTDGGTGAGGGPATDFGRPAGNPLFQGGGPQIETNLPDPMDPFYGEGAPPPSMDTFDDRMRASYARSGFAGTYQEYVTSKIQPTDIGGWGPTSRLGESGMPPRGGGAFSPALPIATIGVDAKAFLRSEAFAGIPWWVVGAVGAAVLVARR